MEFINDDVQLLDEFKSFPTEVHDIPEVPQKRKLTDKAFLIVFGVTLLILVPFLAYTLVYSDILRLSHGYDPCGNVCGENNSVVEGIKCSGADFEDKPYLLFENKGDFENELFQPRHCVKSCPPDYNIFMNRCFKSDTGERASFSKFLKEFADGVRQASGHIVAMAACALGLCILMLLLFRYATKFTVWGIIVISLLGLAILTGLFWFWNLQASDESVSKSQFKAPAIVFTIMTIIYTGIVLCMIKRIELIIMLFREAMKAVFDIPLILLEPLLTFLAIGITLVIYIDVTVWMATSGILQLMNGVTVIDGYEGSVVEYYGYLPNAVMIFSIVFNSIITLWVIQFIIGCQHMVLSGAFSAWYFARDKASLVSPIYNSFYNLIYYHLGTVCIGSLIITAVMLIRLIIRALISNRYGRLFADCCLRAIEDLVKYLTKNAYIQTAMHGQPFLKSGKRGAKLLMSNLVNVVALNSVGDFVLSVAAFLVVLLTVLFGYLMHDDTNKMFGAALFLGGFIATILSYCVFTVFEMAIDTLFICYCEDSIMNDGTTRPYFMTVNLKQFMEDSKKIVPKKN